MNKKVTARRRREIRKRQKERKRTNDALKAERKLLESSQPDGPADGSSWWHENDLAVDVDAYGNVEGQSDNNLSKSK